MFLTFILSSCLQKFNSNTLDAAIERGQIDLSTPAGRRLNKAFSILKKNCNNCHTGYHQGWNSFTNDQKWINAKLINKSDSISSFLIQKLQNTGGNMPLSGQSLSEEDFDSLSDWIDQMDEN